MVGPNTEILKYRSVQAKLRVLVKRILRKYKYPPDDPSTGEYTISVNKVLDQAELLADFWTNDNNVKRV
jgi:type I restriction enzyme R subunit